MFTRGPPVVHREGKGTLLPGGAGNIGEESPTPVFSLFPARKMGGPKWVDGPKKRRRLSPLHTIRSNDAMRQVSLTSRPKFGVNVRRTLRPRPSKQAPAPFRESLLPSGLKVEGLSNIFCMFFIYNNGKWRRAPMVYKTALKTTVFFAIFCVL